MEKKKLLLVAVSVGVFLVIVIGAAILVFSPRNAVAAVNTAAAGTIEAGAPKDAGNVPAEPAVNLFSQPASVDPADMVRNPGRIQGLQQIPSPPEINREDDFFLNSENERQPLAAAESAGTNGQSTIITVTRPTTAAVPDTPTTGRSAPAASRPAAQQAPAARTAPAAPSRSSASTTSTPRTTPAPAKTAASSAANQNNYWVQTGSFSTKIRAEGAKEMLTSKGIVPIIENRDVDGKTFFRVRVGPYTSRNEADYWLSLIKSINGFEDSQIWISQSRP
jgi:DedD protein